MSSLDESYDPESVEKKWYPLWEQKGYFTAQADTQKKPYCIVLPPPNVTGALHMGHALVNTLQDIKIRHKRMQGYEALWIPGTDHAGISTQSVVERHLYAKTGKRKSDFSRDEFLAHVWAWKEEHQDKIINQLKKLGCSLDWSRLRFTMDEPSSFAVKTLFKKLFDDGLIYRGDHLVNWDPVLQTAIADDEVEYEEKSSFLWHIRYGKDLIVATTRPETMLGDVAVAVSPSDPRYQHLIGTTITLPFTQREVPIIADPFVDPQFGTGAVKITPAHDFNDYEVAKRHNLEMINILNPDGTLNAHAMEFSQMTVEEARAKVVARLKKLGLLVKVEPHIHQVGISYRSKCVVEPYLSKQWFVRMTPFKEKLLEAVESGGVKIIPEGWDKVYFHWIKNLRDWCISRQLWWGHRIPIWYAKDNPDHYICHIEDGLPPEVQKAPHLWVQEDDVLDTWFSSALWPLTTLGWPKETEDLKTFYPNATLITGHDILFFWVARMVLTGIYIKEEPPFPETFVHGLIYGKSYWRTREDQSIAYVPADERRRYELGEPLPKDVQSKWEKMSKSKGNIIDPIEIISTYGTDAMRFALTSSVTFARQIDLDLRRFEEFKNFSNKTWNAARFVFMNLKLSSQELAAGIDPSLLTLDDRWILSRLHRTIATVNTSFDRYEFCEAAKTLYTFLWDEFCAYYVETTKPFLFNKEGTPSVSLNKQRILTVVFLAVIRLMHPIAPFITEELFSHLKTKFDATKSPCPYVQDALTALNAPALIVSTYPTPIHTIDTEAEEKLAYLIDVVHAIRNLRAEMQIPPNMALDLYIQGDDVSFVVQNKPFLRALTRISHMHTTTPPALAATAVVRTLKLSVPLPQELQQKEKERLTKELEKETKLILSLEGKLANDAFRSRAPASIIAQVESDLVAARSKKNHLEAKLLHL